MGNALQGLNKELLAEITYPLDDVNITHEDTGLSEEAFDIFNSIIEEHPEFNYGIEDYSRDLERWYGYYTQDYMYVDHYDMKKLDMETIEILKNMDDNLYLQIKDKINYGEPFLGVNSETDRISEYRYNPDGPGGLGLDYSIGNKIDNPNQSPYGILLAKSAYEQIGTDTTRPGAGTGTNRGGGGDVRRGWVCADGICDAYQGAGVMWPKDEHGQAISYLPALLDAFRGIGPHGKRYEFSDDFDEIVKESGSEWTDEQVANLQIGDIIFEGSKSQYDAPVHMMMILGIHEDGIEVYSEGGENRPTETRIIRFGNSDKYKYNNLSKAVEWIFRYNPSGDMNDNLAFMATNIQDKPIFKGTTFDEVFSEGMDNYERIIRSSIWSKIDEDPGFASYLMDELGMDQFDSGFKYLDPEEQMSALKSDFSRFNSDFHIDMYYRYKNNLPTGDLYDENSYSRAVNEGNGYSMVHDALGIVSPKDYFLKNYPDHISRLSDAMSR